MVRSVLVAGKKGFSAEFGIGQLTSIAQCLICIHLAPFAANDELRQFVQTDMQLRIVELLQIAFKSFAIPFQGL